jgi:4-hydroxybenzoate polyprenyltransferase
MIDQFTNRASGRAEQRSNAGLVDYIAIARPDHWLKHVFIIPGIVLAHLLVARGEPIPWLVIIAGFVVAALISSANYVINEWLDARFDQHHPMKSKRPAVAKQLSPRLVYAEYALLTVAGLGLAALISTALFVIALVFWLSGVIYNVEPFRSKDKAYVDVASEALNNPIRLVIGWVLIDPSSLPPSSLIVAYWAGGAFLMSIKRLAEYRTIVASHNAAVLHLYRRSFQHYDETKLLIQSFLYAQLASFFIAVFLIKYRIEYILSFPLFAALFTIYLALGLRLGSNAQTPEKLFKEGKLIGIVGALVVALVLLTVFDIPALDFLSDPYIMGLSW